MTESPLVDSGFAVPVFSPGDDLIVCLNKAMAFLIAVASSRFPSTNNQLRTSLNLRNHAIIQDGRVTVQQVQGRQGQSYSDTGYKSNATSSRGTILSEDFRKRFTPQQKLDVEQAFWFRISNPTIESSNQPPVKVEVPSEPPKASFMNASLEKLKFHLTQFDSVVKKRTTPDARTEDEWRFEHTKAVLNNEIIPFLKSLKDIFNVFDKDLLNEIMEVQTIFDQMDAAVQQSSVDKQCLEIAKKELLLENDQLLQQIMSQDVL
nr:hypothetical protein [Tanacetum cinerariifolium]